MSTVQSRPPTKAVFTQEPVFPLSVEVYQSLIASGELTSDDPVELIEGVLVFKMPTDEPHNAATAFLNDCVQNLLVRENFAYRNQQTLTLTDGEPQPDGAIAIGDKRHFTRLGRKPFGNEVPWIAEVSDATLARDRGMKLRSYARAGIPVYWIVNLQDRQIEVYTDPDSAAAEPAYRTQQVFDAAAKVPVVLAGQTVGEIAVADVLP